MAELYTRGSGEKEMLRSFILSKRTGEAHYLYSETATYIGGRKEIKGNNIKGKRKKMRVELHI